MPGYLLIVCCSLCLFVVVVSGCSQGIEANSQGDVSNGPTPPLNQEKTDAPVREEIEKRPQNANQSTQGPNQSEKQAGHAQGPRFQPISTESVKPHVENLISFLQTQEREAGKNTNDLSTVLQASFRFAQERSRQTSAKHENRLALVALGMVVGHPRLGWVVGFVPDQSTAIEIKRLGKRVRLRGRRDLARHFCVSAAAVALTNKTLSKFIGQLKEQFDAGAGGSGFSFVDLLADQAGTRFGVNASRSDRSAERLQRHLTRSPSVADFMPTLKGLPEGLSRETVNTEYGGFDGEGFRRMEEEIRRRLDRCLLLQD